MALAAGRPARRRYRPTVLIADETFPTGTGPERELLLRWLGYLHGAVLRKADGISETDSRWRPHGRLIPLLGIVRHLTQVEWRWIDGEFLGESVSRSDDEFDPGPELTITAAVAAYRARALRTAEIVAGLPLDTRCGREPDTDLRWVLLHLINETARHAGHADAVRELVDGTTGE